MHLQHVQKAPGFRKLTVFCAWFLRALRVPTQATLQGAEVGSLIELRTILSVLIKYYAGLFLFFLETNVLKVLFTRLP